MSELGHLQEAEPVVINVKMFHGDDRKSVHCDPATNAEEACKELARQKNIKSTFGWSLFAECEDGVKEACVC